MASQVWKRVYGRAPNTLVKRTRGMLPRRDSAKLIAFSFLNDSDYPDIKILFGTTGIEISCSSNNSCTSKSLYPQRTLGKSGEQTPPD